MFSFFFRPSREQLADWFNEKQLRPLRRAVTVAPPEARAISADYLGALGDPESIGVLSQAAEEDAVPAVRLAAARALGRLGSGALAPLARALRNDPEVAVRESAARGLGATSLAAVPALELALQSDPKGSVRAEAARSLGRLSAEGSAKALSAALLAGHPALTEGAAAALDALGQGAALQGRARAAFLVGLGRFSEAVEEDPSAVELLLLRAALCRDGSAFPPNLLETLYRNPSSSSAPFLEHRLLGLRRALSGGPTPETYQKLQAEAARIEASLAALQAEGAHTVSTQER